VAVVALEAGAPEEIVFSPPERAGASTPCMRPSNDRRDEITEGIGIQIYSLAKFSGAHQQKAVSPTTHRQSHFYLSHTRILGAGRGQGHVHYANLTIIFNFIFISICKMFLLFARQIKYSNYEK
jgi:hypothetical protein